MKTISILFLVTMSLLPVRAGVPLVIVLDPDNYADGTVLNHIIPEVSLVTAGANNLPIPFDVRATQSTTQFPPPTGLNVFSHAGGIPFWNSDRRLRMDFVGLVSGISIDFQGISANVQESGRLEVYDMQNVLIGSYTTAGLLAGQTETMSINRVLPDIAYALAYTVTATSPFGRLDHLVFDQPVPVPEPSILWLLGVPLVGVFMLRRHLPA